MSHVDVVIPVYNEEDKLPRCIAALRTFLQEQPAHAWRITVANNASLDRTLQIAQELSRRHPDVHCLHLDQKGRGRALKAAWLASPADILCYMDVDLSTGLDALPPMIDALAAGRCQVACGSRLKRESRVQRCVKREVLSRGYNLLVWACYPRKTFSDTQIGFKALTRQAARELLPRIVDNQWFFDTELLVEAQRLGFAIQDFPVAWQEDADSRVKLGRTALDNIKGLARLKLRRTA